jgi:hypothetical protein
MLAGVFLESRVILASCSCDQTCTNVGATVSDSVPDAQCPTSWHGRMQAACIADLQAKVTNMAARMDVAGQMADAAVTRAGELAEARAQMAAKTREVGSCARWLRGVSVRDGSSLGTASLLHCDSISPVQTHVLCHQRAVFDESWCCSPGGAAARGAG